ncbi:hypothetical protein FHS32_002558 [Streptomyces albaduncus]|uniref:Uncharacterized protein n=1 Tax=Streptomyces griseoloalbus TaxID=67303 RepID=A0A7W8F920_9ACTN|nr:hypothetical protein [Streptomyces albaduncus]
MRVLLSPTADPWHGAAYVTRHSTVPHGAAEREASAPFA